MAPVLVCPECGTKHPLDGVNGSAFPCRGCGRTLKVPAQAGAAASGVPRPRTAVVEPTGTGVMPTPVLPPERADTPGPADTPRPAPVGKAAGRFDPVPGRWIRFLLWFVAVPLAFLIVFGAAKLLGVLSTNQVENVALDEGWNRFVPIVRLLPFVALLTAGFVQGTVYGITRFRARRHVPPPAGKPSRPERPSRPGNPSRSGSSASVS